MNESTPVVILHLSDLHFGSDAECIKKRDQRAIALNSLIDTLKILPDEWKPDLVCVTGDIAFSGIESDYKEAELWFHDLLHVLDLTVEDILLCPGNHDFEWSKADCKRLPERISINEVDDLFALPLDPTDKLHAPFSNYLAFCSNLGVPKFKCGDKESFLAGILERKGIKFLCVNSAWLAFEDHLQGDLCLGLPILDHMEARKQLVPAMESPQTVVTLMHHPFDWLHGAETAKWETRTKTIRLLCDRSLLLLTGHTHDAEADWSLVKECWHMPVGAAYHSGRHQNGFQLLKIEGDNFSHFQYGFTPGATENRWKAKSEPYKKPLKVTDKTWTYLAGAGRMSSYLLSGNEDAAPAPVSAATLVQTSADIVPTPGSIDESANEEFQKIREHILAGRTKRAEGELRQLYSSIAPKGVSNELLAKIATNLGICLRENRDESGAAEQFNIAIQHNPNYAIAFACLADLQVSQSNFSEARTNIEQARQLQPLNTGVLLIYSGFLMRSGMQDELKLLLDELELVENTTQEWKLMLAQLILDAGNPAQAKRKLLSLGPPDDLPVGAKEMLARCILEDCTAQITSTLDQEDFALSQNIKHDLLAAKDLFNTVIAECNQFDSLETRVALVTNRAAVNMRLYEWTEAIEDYDKLFAIDPSNSQITAPRILALTAVKRFDEAIRLVGPEVTAQSQLALADALVANGLPSKALDLTDKFSPQSEDEMISKIRIQAQAYKDLNRTSEADQLLKDLEKYPNNCTALCMRAKSAYESSNIATSIEILRKAEDCAVDLQTKQMVAFNLAQTLLVVGSNAEAVSMLESLDLSNDSMLLQLYARALVFTGRRPGRAFQIISSKIDKWQNEPEVLKIFIHLLRQAGHLEKATEYARILVINEPLSDTAKLLLADLLMVAGNNDEAASLLEKVNKDALSSNVQNSIKFAHQLISLGLAEEAVVFMLGVRNGNYADANAHMAYFNCCIHLPRNHKFHDPEQTVRPGTFVTIKESDQTSTWHILESGNADLRRNEMLPTHDLAKRLIGHALNEEVVIRTDPSGSSKASIEKILNPYQKAFSEINQFPTLFPERKDILKFTITDVTSPDFEHMVAASQTPRTPQDGVAPLSIEKFAKLLSQAMPNTWLGLIKSRSVGCGSCVALSFQMSAANSANEIVLDTSSALTLCRLGIEHLAVQEFQTIYIAGNVLEALHEAKLETSIGLHEEELSFLERVHTFCLSLKTASITAVFDDGYSKLEKFGDCSAASVLLALEHAVPLYSDDLKVTGLTTHQLGSTKFRSFSTGAFLMRLLEAGKLKDNEFNQLNAQLDDFNYFRPTVDTSDLILMAEKNNWVLTPDFRILVRTGSTQHSLNTASKIAAQFIRAAFFSEVSLQSSNALVRSLLLGFAAPHPRKAFRDAVLNYQATTSSSHNSLILSILQNSVRTILD